jgi:hypothetical protein
MKLERLDRDKHPSLFSPFKFAKKKMFREYDPGTFSFSPARWARVFVCVKYFQLSLTLSSVPEVLKLIVPLNVGTFPALKTNIRLRWKYQPSTTLAQLAESSITI